MVIACFGIGYLNLATRATTIMTTAQWQAKYNQTRPYWIAVNTPLSTTNDSWGFYNLGYGVDSEVSMLEATGELTYLDKALTYANNVKNNARVSSSISTSQFHDSYLGWVNHSHPQIGDDGQEYPLFESYMWRYVTRMLRVMHSSPSVMSNPTYKAQYDALLAFTETNIFDKWYTRSQGNIYRQNTHMAAHWAYMALDLSLLTTSPARKTLYGTVFNNISYVGLPGNGPNTGLRGQLQPFPDASIGVNGYFWNENWGQMSRPGSDVNHGNGVMSFLVEAVDVGRYWTTADALKFARPLTRAIMPNHALYVDGTGAGNGWLNDGYVKLGRYDEVTQIDLQTASVQGAQFYASMALNAKILSGNISTPTPTMQPTSTPAPIAKVGDINGNGKVDIFDLSALLSGWGSATTKLDLNNDGIVNILDLSALLSHWTG